MPKRGIKLDQIDEYPGQIGFSGLGMLDSGDFFGTARYSSAWSNVQMANSAGVANGRLHSWPVPITEPVTVDALRFSVGTAADAGDEMRMGIYLGDGAGGRPATLIVQTADIAIDTTGDKTSTFTAVLLSPGLYWFAIQAVNVTGSTNPFFRGSGDVNWVSYYAARAVNTNNFSNHLWATSGQGATMPTTYPFGAGWSGGVQSSGGLFYIQARVA